MIRMGLGANSRHASMLVTPGNGVQWTMRTTDGGATTHPAMTANTVKAPIFLKVTKTATTFTGYYSNDGANWTQLGSPVPIAITSGSTYYVGLAATSNTSGLNTTAASNFNF